MPTPQCTPILPSQCTGMGGHIDPLTGEVLERLEMPRGVFVSGLESDGGDQFFCGGGKSGKVRAVRRPAKRKTEGQKTDGNG